MEQQYFDHGLQYQRLILNDSTYPTNKLPICEAWGGQTFAGSTLLLTAAGHNALMLVYVIPYRDSRLFGGLLVTLLRTSCARWIWKVYDTDVDRHFPCPVSVPAGREMEHTCQ